MCHNAGVRAACGLRERRRLCPCELGVQRRRRAHKKASVRLSPASVWPLSRNEVWEKTCIVRLGNQGRPVLGNSDPGLGSCVHPLLLPLLLLPAGGAAPGTQRFTPPTTPRSVCAISPWRSTLAGIPTLRRASSSKGLTAKSSSWATQVRPYARDLAPADAPRRCGQDQPAQTLHAEQVRSQEHDVHKRRVFRDEEGDPARAQGPPPAVGYSGAGAIP